MPATARAAGAGGATGPTEIANVPATGFPWADAAAAVTRIAATAGSARHWAALEFAHLRADVVPTAVFAASAGRRATSRRASTGPACGNGWPRSRSSPAGLHPIALTPVRSRPMISFCTWLVPS